MKLGKLSPRYDARTLKLARYVDLQLLPKAPAETQRATSFGTALQMYSNDSLGDCTCAGIGNLTQFWRSLTSLRDPLTTEQVVSTYEKLCGYNPNDPTTDRGGVELDILKAWQRDGIYGHQLGAFAAVNLRNEALIRAACWLFDGLYIGVALPQTAQDQDVWDVDAAAGSAAYPGSWGGHCLAPGTRVLTDDLRWIPIEDVNEGEGLVGFDEHQSAGTRRAYQRSVVEKTQILELPCYDLTFSDGTQMRCSYDHQWLVGRDSRHWLPTEKMRVGRSSVVKPLTPWDTDTSRDAGYLAAAFDGEGWIAGEIKRAIHKIGFSQRDNEMWHHVTRALKERDFDFNERTDIPGTGYTPNVINGLTVGHRDNMLRFLGSIRPHRLLAKFSADRLGAMYGKNVQLVEKRPAGVSPVVALQTSARTFIAEGFASHNCVITVDYNETGPVYATWGALKQATWAWHHAYCDEQWALISPDQLRADGDTAEGFDVAALTRDLQLVTAA